MRNVRYDKENATLNHRVYVDHKQYEVMGKIKSRFDLIAV